MASRIVFLPKFQDPWYEEKVVTFEWVPGMAKSQARKSINNLHEAAQAQLDLLKPLEISTKSNTDLGVSLSAFNLQLDVDTHFVSIESAYQSSKIFKNGGPFRDILNLNSYDAKKDERLKFNQLEAFAGRWINAIGQITEADGTIHRLIPGDANNLVYRYSDQYKTWIRMYSEQITNV